MTRNPRYTPVAAQFAKEVPGGHPGAFTPPYRVRLPCSPSQILTPCSLSRVVQRMCLIQSEAWNDAVAGSCISMLSDLLVAAVYQQVAYKG